VLSPFEVQRAYSALFNAGAPRFSGDEMTDTKLEADAGGAKASNNPRQMPHFTAIIHPFVAADMRQNSTVVTAWSFSDINRLYNYEVGEFNGIRFCESNMVPSFTGIANSGNPNFGTITFTPAVTGGNLTAAGGPYFVQVTGRDLQNQFESQVFQISASQAIASGVAGSIAVALPTNTAFSYTIYISTSASMANASIATVSGTPLGLQTTGQFAGQAVTLAANQTVTVTGFGTAQQPPASPGIGITAYATFIIGRGAYGQVKLDDVKFTYLKEADKSDPLNQLRVVGWKTFYGTIILNQNFFMRVESVSAFSGNFDHPSGIPN
jgi:hypothetical protein